MRIVGGDHKGRIIEVGKEFDSRPTTDFAREALFNILTNHFDFTGVSFLDLFGGSGSLSFECNSRGCRKIDLVETNYRSVQFILKGSQMKMTGIHAVKMDVFRFLKLCRKQIRSDLCRSPYELKNLAELPEAVLDRDLLLPEGWFMLEHSRKHNFNHEPGFFDERKYGNVHFSFFRK